MKQITLNLYLCLTSTTARQRTINAYAPSCSYCKNSNSCLILLLIATVAPTGDYIVTTSIPHVLCQTKGDYRTFVLEIGTPLSPPVRFVFRSTKFRFSYGVPLRKCFVYNRLLSITSNKCVVTRFIRTFENKKTDKGRLDFTQKLPIGEYLTK